MEVIGQSLPEISSPWDLITRYNPAAIGSTTQAATAKKTRGRPRKHNLPKVENTITKKIEHEVSTTRQLTQVEKLDMYRLFRKAITEEESQRDAIELMAVIFKITYAQAFSELLTGAQI